MLRSTLCCVIKLQAVSQTAVNSLQKFIINFLILQTFFLYLQQLQFPHMTETFPCICCVETKMMKCIKNAEKLFSSMVHNSFQISLQLLHVMYCRKLMLILQNTVLLTP